MFVIVMSRKQYLRLKIEMKKEKKQRRTILIVYWDMRVIHHIY